MLNIKGLSNESETTLFKLIFLENIKMSLYSNFFPLEPFSWSQQNKLIPKHIRAANYHFLIMYYLRVFCFPGFLYFPVIEFDLVLPSKSRQKWQVVRKCLCLLRGLWKATIFANQYPLRTINWSYQCNSYCPYVITPIHHKWWYQQQNRSC